jgi:hypothetical protein
MMRRSPLASTATRRLRRRTALRLSDWTSLTMRRAHRCARRPSA